MLRSFDTVWQATADLMRGRPARLTGAALATVMFAFMGGVATGTITGFTPFGTSSDASAGISASPQVQAVKEQVRNQAIARVAGGRMAAPVTRLPAVSASMSDAAFYAVTANAVQIAGTQRLNKKFANLSPKQLERERKCLAEAIYHEARSEGAQGKLAVAEVVLTRADDRRYPSTICGVVYQGANLSTGCQFSWTCDGLRDTAAEKDAWEKSMSIASYVMLDVKWEEVTGKATHYHADYVSPYWAPTLDETATVGRHVFYRWTAYNGLRDS